MGPRALWPGDPIFIEIGVQDARLALALRHSGYTKYLGVSGSAQRVSQLQAQHPELAGQLTCSRRKKLVLHNNAEVLVLSGAALLHIWRFRAIRHAQCVAWRAGWNLLTLVALVACLLHKLAKRCVAPRLVTFELPGGKTCRMFTCSVLRQRNCYRNQLHFIPHCLGLAGMFREFERQQARYVVLRWFEPLPHIEPDEDVDLLIEDESLGRALAVLRAQPGIQPCDVYSETALSKSAYCGAPYYPARVAGRLLDGAVRHKNLCAVPNPWDYFHSLAYHAVYHKGERSGLPCREPSVRTNPSPAHDYAGILIRMADALAIDVEISLEGLHDYLQAQDWGPSPEELARLARACPRNRWLQVLDARLPSHVHDQGLTVFVLRQQAVRQGFQSPMIDMIRQGGFEILATKMLAPAEVEYSAARTRGGDWSDGPFESPGGPPAVCVVAYDRHPLPMTRYQQRKFPHRTNARVFVKEAVRDAVLAALPREQGSNALHSSDHAAEAWHLIEVFAPELIDRIKHQLQQIRRPDATVPGQRRAA